RVKCTPSWWATPRILPGSSTRRKNGVRRTVTHDADQAQAQERAEERARQHAHKQGQEAARWVSEEDAQVYRLHAADSSSESQDQVDVDVAKKMLKAKHSLAEVRAVLHASPDLAKRHFDVKTYVKEAVKNAQQALKAAVP
ncbi:putative membrane protein YccC, partial [Polaromonas sp. CG_9.5]|uniref:hypothetical protein n=1 Tax=Polaromonas sp. CG_9.5 TaxID=3071705 RepID=UPI002E021011|nr:putative membrane protein YccC [Polaromonas sp. CG_9.5]